MAGSKSISRKHHVRSGSPARKSRHKSAVSPPLPSEALRIKSSNTLACVETCWIALQTLDDRPEIGTITMALERAVKCLRSTHADLELFIDSVES